MFLPLADGGGSDRLSCIQSKKLLIPLGSEDGRFDQALRAETQPCGKIIHFFYDANVLFGFTDDAPFSDLATADLKLRFDEDDKLSVRFKDVKYRGQDLCHRYKRYVHHCKIKQIVKIPGRQLTGVRVFADLDARVVSKRPNELVRSDIDRDDSCRAVF